MGRSARALSGLADLGAWPVEVAAGALWPRPHDPRFDFAADASGARWIDVLAERARRVLSAGRARDLVAGHADWRVEHVRFGDDGEVCAVHDWDSLRIVPEPALAGKAAASFTTDWSRALERRYPTIDEALAFIAGVRGGPRCGVRPAPAAALAGLTHARALLRSHGEMLLAGRPT